MRTVPRLSVAFGKDIEFSPLNRLKAVRFFENEAEAKMYFLKTLLGEGYFHFSYREKTAPEKFSPRIVTGTIAILKPDRFVIQPMKGSAVKITLEDLLWAGVLPVAGWDQTLSAIERLTSMTRSLLVQLWTETKKSPSKIQKGEHEIFGKVMNIAAQLDDVVYFRTFDGIEHTFDHELAELSVPDAPRITDVKVYNSNEEIIFEYLSSVELGALLSLTLDTSQSFGLNRNKPVRFKGLKEETLIATFAQADRLIQAPLQFISEVYQTPEFRE